MGFQPLSNISQGSIVKLKEDNTLVDFYVVVHNYESGLNGAGRTLLLRKNCYNSKKWNNTNGLFFINCTLYTWLNNTYLGLFDEKTQEAIGTTKYYYTANLSRNDVEPTTSAIFLPSVTELGSAGGGTYAVEGTIFPNYSLYTWESGKNDIYYQWTRTISVDDARYAFHQGTYGLGSVFKSTSSGVRPCFTLPSTILVQDDGTIVPYDPPTQPASINVPTVSKGQPCTITWTAATDPNSGGSIISYTLQRSINNSAYETIYTGAELTYTDTIGDNWATVSYQVAATNNFGLTGNYVTSETQTVSSGVLYVAGPAINLGLQTQPFTFTFSIEVTGASSTITDIAVTVLGDSNLIYSGNVSSGQQIDVPVDIRVIGGGGHNISVSASKEDYVPIQTFYTFSTNELNLPSGGIGIQLEDNNGNPLFPQTVASLVKGLYGQNIGDNLQNLIPAVLYSNKQRAKYKEVKIDLSNVNVGDIIQLPYNGLMVDHIVVNIGNPDASIYDASCDGVWLLRKDCIGQGQWNNTDMNTLANSTIMNTMQTYVANYSSEVQSAIKTVKIPYCIGGGNWSVNTLGNGLECKIFPLSGYEIGLTQNDINFLPIDGAKLSYFESGTTTSALNKRSLSSNWWLRSAFTNYRDYYLFCYVLTDGRTTITSYKNSHGYRPAFIMPTTFSHTYYVGNGNNVFPSQEYISAGVFTDYFGNDIPVPKVETGSYVGTGTYGQSNPNTLQFSCPPKLVIVVTEKISDVSYGAKPGFLILVANNSMGIGQFISPNTPIGGANEPTYSIFPVLSFSGNSVSWYISQPMSVPTAVQCQLNESGRTYRYVALC